MFVYDTYTHTDLQTYKLIYEQYSSNIYTYKYKQGWLNI